LANVSAPRLTSALPLPGLPFLPFPERLLQAPRLALDAALLPAYIAAQLIQRGWLQALPGPPGRAPDPYAVTRGPSPIAWRRCAIPMSNLRPRPHTGPMFP